jgi:signal peptide peptidase SppA
MADKYSRVLSALMGHPWAIRQGTLDTICGIVTARAEGVRLTKAEIQARVGAAAARPSKEVVGTVGVIPVFGVLAQRMDMFTDISGGTSYQQLSKQLREFRDDDSVKHCVFEHDSPGGDVFGLQELADEIYAARAVFAARGGKLVAMVNPQCASASLYLAAACHEIVITPSGAIGSIGTVCVHTERSAMNEMMGIKPTYITSSPFKQEDNQDTPLSAEAYGHLKAMVDEYGAQFEKFVAKARGVTPAKVRNEFGGGRMLMAKDALRVGLVDRISTMDDLMAKLVGRKAAAGVRAEETAPAVSAVDDQPVAAADDTTPAIAAETDRPTVAAEDPVLEVQAAATPVATEPAAPLVDVELEDMDLALRLAEHR